MPKPKTVSDPTRVRKVMAFLSDSVDDYVAARVLFLAHLPQQGAILASTAIEKACKAILAFNGMESHGHLKKSHWNAVRNFDRQFVDRFNTGFLQLNQKAYLLRYSDDLPPGFNLVIASREFLASLDDFLMSFHGSFAVGADPKNSKLHGLFASRDERVITDNWVFSRIPNKESFILAAPQFIYECRLEPRGTLLTATYMSSRPAKREGFLREGCVILPATAGHKCDLSHFPTPEDQPIPADAAVAS
jgi:hypothetical protein